MSGKRGAFTLSVYCVQRLLLGSVTLPIEKTKSLASVVGAPGGYLHPVGSSAPVLAFPVL